MKENSLGNKIHHFFPYVHPQVFLIFPLAYFYVVLKMMASEKRVLPLMMYILDKNILLQLSKYIVHKHIMISFIIISFQVSRKIFFQYANVWCSYCILENDILINILSSKWPTRHNGHKWSLVVIMGSFRTNVCAQVSTCIQYLKTN